MSENLRKLIGVVVMAAIVVVGVVVTNDDDSDFTRNRALRRGAESTSTSSNDSVATALGSSTESGEVRNQSDATSLRSESSGTVETATRLDGGNELATADCCDQNAYEILKLQNELADLEKEVADSEDAVEAVKELIDEIQAGSCSSNILSVKKQGTGPMCAYLEHVNLRKIIDEVSTNWLTSETWDPCYFIVLCIDQGEIYDVEEPTNVKAPEYLWHLYDKYVDFQLICPRYINVVPDDVWFKGLGYYKKPWLRPQLSISPKAGSAHIYEIAVMSPQTTASDSPITFTYGESFDSARTLVSGESLKFIQWDRTGNEWWDHWETGSVTVKIFDADTQEKHYLTVQGSLTYALFEESGQALIKGKGKARCEADLTIWRTYDEQL